MSYYSKSSSKTRIPVGPLTIPNNGLFNTIPTNGDFEVHQIGMLDLELRIVTLLIAASSGASTSSPQSQCHYPEAYIDQLTLTYNTAKKYSSNSMHVGSTVVRTTSLEDNATTYVF